MRHFRAIARILLILMVILFLMVIWTVGRIVAFRSVGTVRRLRRWTLQSWSRSICRIMGIKINQTGDPPPIPFCLVSNHISYVDVLIIYATAQCLLISKADIKKWPLIGFLAGHFGTLFIDRERARDVVRIGNLIQSSIEEGDGVAFFPEGTSTGGEDVGRFNSSLLEFPVRDGFPVHFAAIRYATRKEDPPASLVIGWWGTMPFASHIYNLLGLQGFEAYITYGEHPVAASDRKLLAMRLRDHVKQIFHPTL